MEEIQTEATIGMLMDYRNDTKQPDKQKFTKRLKTDALFE